MPEAIGVLRFADRNRYGETGIPTTLLFGGGKKWIVNCKKATKRNHWAKIRVGDDEHRGELVEVLGEVGEHDVELRALQLFFGVQPCRYPPRGDWGLSSSSSSSRRSLPAKLGVFSADNEGTRDIDDALSLSVENKKRVVLGVHVADVASKIGAGSPLFEWARVRGASAYHGSGSVPMLPPELAHDEFSLNQGVRRNTLTLWLTVEDGRVVRRSHERTSVVNADATTYAAFGACSRHEKARDLLRRLSGREAPEDLIAWTMIEYNAYFGELLARSSKWPGGVLRAQADRSLPAVYARSDSVDAGHASLELENYAHCSSPIRRFADLLNQNALLEPTASSEGFGLTGWGDEQLETLNERCAQLHRYHATIDAMELAYLCREAPRVYDAYVDLGDDGECVFVRTEKRRFRVPLRDSYFAEPVAKALGRRRRRREEGPVKVELCGVLAADRTRLRMRLVDDDDDQEEEDEEEEDEDDEERTLPSSARAWIRAASRGREDEDEESPVLLEERVNSVLGYRIDDFQKRCLQVINDPQLDLLAMAPTGSGKTAVALVAILQAFERGKRAVYTSPIKALSNQKFAEFTSWFRKRGLDAHVSLLTGDVKIRSPPGTEKELVICTSEILRNKLVKASGRGGEDVVAAARGAAEAGDEEAAKALATLVADGRLADVDPDLERLGCVVSDEIHYINDVERGAVWEETLMHMPKDVQMVALSATLRDPEHFVAWIESTRGRNGRLVVRPDRHVPLKVGGVNPKTGEFAEFYGTHDTPDRKKGKFDVDQFNALFSRKALEKEAEDSAQKLADKAKARAERDAERQAQRDAYSGGGGGGGGSAAAPPPSSSSSSSQKKKKKAAAGPSPVNFEHECVKLARALDSADKLPGIVFCMSRRLCVRGAHACEALNLLLGTKPQPKKSDEDDAEDAAREKARSERAAATERARRAMHRKHLQRYMPELGELEAYRDIDRLLERGIAYHHSGMLPILREYVELCFQQRLVKLVFATETLAVGVNMPARTVAFSQLDKPDDTGAKEGHRWLRVDEFWQMAGRAGRRGLDEVGYVVYAPKLSVAGLKNLAPLHEVNRMLTGDVQAATSQLDVDRPFVLRHLARGHDSNILKRTLRADQLRRENDVARRRLRDQHAVDAATATSFSAYDAIQLRLNQKLPQKEVKRLTRERRGILDAYPGGADAFLSAKRKATESRKATLAIEKNDTRLEDDWHAAYLWLRDASFLDDDGRLAPRGRAAAAFSDGEPLILGTCVADGAIARLDLPEICAFIALFIPNRCCKDDEPLPADVISSKLSQNLLETFDYADQLAHHLHKDDLPRNLATLVLDWCRTKDIHRIAACVDPHLLGSFVKVIMRVLSYVDALREVLLGLQYYETHNVLDHHADALLFGLVTNESLYLRIDDDDGGGGGSAAS
ncbi:hypothetical protein CTAYLR_001776 [Chrysophaeum taylorii]|uniref:RNA helicase n=1 Tax=Chrysophaeum taylorii TaxID=2483200 RepID=A0AAD7UES9_9STRA|nr:hypothetical protein CTAYLR_001776 [Chrysophaeum taylorii]